MQVHFLPAGPTTGLTKFKGVRPRAPGARERIRLWVKHYNPQRPHQSLEGLCPADRFFSIAQELRKVMERGIQENALELALRGSPNSSRG